MNDNNRPQDIAAELLMSPAERARHNECPGVIKGMDTRINRAYQLAQDQANDIQAAKSLLDRIEKALPRRSFF